jgi:superfamily II DNA/RNA helicase
MEFYEQASDPPDVDQKLDDLSDLEYRSGDLLATLADLLQSCYENFNWRPWQVAAIKRSLNLFRQDNYPSPGVLIEASVGSGKTLVATSLMFHRIMGCTAYKSKVLFLSPLVALVKEQYVFFSSLCDAFNAVTVSGRPLRVAYRCGSEIETNVRLSHIICATYEHGRTLLSNGDLQIYPSSRRLKRTWAGSIRMVVIDEIHNLMSDRGPILAAILGFCRRYDIPVMAMTGTTPRSLRECLNQFFRPSFLTVSNENDSRCTQIPVRIDDQAQFITAMCGLIVNSLTSMDHSDGVLIFCPNIREMRPLMDLVLETLMGWRTRAGRVEDPQKHDALVRFYADLDDAATESISELIDVQWSGYSSPDKGDDERGCLANERRLCHMLARVGIFYYWRNIGDRYTELFLDQLKRREVRAIFSTSTLAAGVNLPGIRHVFIASQIDDMAQLGQMIGRCGRESEGFAFLLSQSPPTTEQVYQSLPMPCLDVRIHLMKWFIVKKAQSIQRIGGFSEGLWSLTVDQWRGFLVSLPLPNVPGDPDKDFYTALNDLLEVLKLVVISPEGVLQSRVTPSLYRVSQEDPELLPIVFICCGCVGEMGVMSETFCPLIISVLYWLSQRRRLPRMIRPPDGIDVIMSPLANSPFPMPVADMFRATQYILDTLSRKSGILVHMRGWQVRQLTDIVVLTCCILVGFAPPWNRLVPRSPFCEHLLGMQLYPAVVDDALLFLGKRPQNIDQYVTIHQGLLEQAVILVNEFARDYARGRRPRPHESNPLTRYVSSRGMLVKPNIGEWIGEFGRSYPVTRSQIRWIEATSSAGILFGNDWLEVVLPLSPDAQGELDLNPMDPNSD